MTLSQFIEKYNGKKIDFDGAYNAQCVDLHRFYVKEVLDTAQTPPVIGAYQIFATAPETFERIRNTPLGLPKAGDIMIWDKGYSQYGHVGVFVSGNLLRFKAFEQNDPVGFGCQIKEYSYKYIIGWLRLKKPNYVTQSYKGEMRLIPNELRADSIETWEKLCKDRQVDPKIINEEIK